MERRVDMVRIERKEELFDREEVLGRDASSVFPSQTKKDAANGAAMDAEAIREMLGARKFVSESELEEIKAKRGVSVDDGTSAPLKPLSEVLKENKERKEAEFQEGWKQMKTGKNRPLDADELEFLDNVAAAEAAREQEARERERTELEEFRQMLERAAAQKQAEAGPGSATTAVARTSTASKAAPRIAPHSAAIKTVIKPIVKVKPKAEEKKPASKPSPGAATAGGDDEPASKRLRTGASESEPVAGGAVQKAAASRGQDAELAPSPDGLAGLLGGYGSDSDD